MQYCLRGLRDSFGPCQSNAAYLCGILCHWCGQDATKYYLDCLQALRPLFDSQEGVIKDNACGAVGRMIINSPEAVPLSQVISKGSVRTPSETSSMIFEKSNFKRWKFQVLPVFIDALPLRQDFEENKPAYGAIFKLFHTNNEAVHILSLF
jgi:hypothetical protein